MPDRHGPASPEKQFLRAPISRGRYLCISLIGFASLTAAWALVAEAEVFQRMLLPSPLDVLRALWMGLTSGELVADVWASVYRVMAGFLAGALLSAPIGLVVGTMP